jgi:hypothetical protein
MRIKHYLPTPSLLLTALLSGVVCFVVAYALFESAKTSSVEAAPIPSPTITNSLRLNDDDTAYLSRTPTSVGSRTTFTYSAWIKRANLGSQWYVFNADGAHSGDTTFFGLYFNSSNNLSVTTWATEYRRTVAMFRDPTAWMHVVLSVDTNQAVADNRIRLYIDGVEQTYSVLSNPSQGATLGTNAAVAHFLSGYSSGTNAFDGYFSQVQFVDGQQLGPDAFGAHDNAGRWRPVAYAGTYGTNGFKLDFSLSTSSASLGRDASGNNNYFTTTNIDLTDQVIDTPNNNFATGNALQPSSGTFSNGNLVNAGLTRSTIFMSTGKWYWEVRANAASVVAGVIEREGIANTTSVANGTLTGFRFDADAGTLASTTDGSSFIGQVSGLTGGRFAYATGGSNTLIYGAGGTTTLTYDSASGGYFRFTPPSTYKALSTANMSAPVISRPRDYFDIRTYNGTSTAQTIGGFDFSPNLVWIKATSTTADPGLFDSIRSAGNVLIPSKTNAEAASSTAFTAFTSNGFSLGPYGAFNNPSTTTEEGVNPRNGGYVAWAWDESPAAGFDIVTYTGDNTSNRTIAHSLGGTPEFVIVKRRDSTGNWYVGGTVVGTSSAYYLWNSTAATSTSNSPWCTTCAASNWNSSTFMVTNNATNNLNAASATYVAYLFRSIDGFSAFGTYRGNASTDGPFVYTGFKPKWLYPKRGDAADGTGPNFLDAGRSPVNPLMRWLHANLSAVEGSGTAVVDFISNGFKIRYNGADVNVSGATYIYAAFADAPFVIASTASIAGTTITKDTYFKKSLYVAVAVAKGSGTFMIDHPLDPKNKLLYHSFVESPDMKNLYDGVAELNSKGEAVVELPSYFLKLNKDYRYLATPMGEPMPNLYLKKEVRKKYWLFGTPVLVVSGGAPGGKISWQVTGIRQDPIAKNNPVIVEVDKDQTDLVKKGEYLHPEAYGQTP